MYKIMDTDFCYILCAFRKYRPWGKGSLVNFCVHNMKLYTICCMKNKKNWLII